jgi:ribonucleoside-diphosphate reductase alpha chain
VITPPEDNLESIFECGAKLARTFSYGGGCGTDVSKLAPSGAKVRNAADTTTGTTSFMDFFSYVTGLIGQKGRRGALMLSINCNHPDLEDFINLKSDLNLCTKANISVKVSDSFMQAVQANGMWEMRFRRPETNETILKTAKARDLFMLLAKRNWEMAEPGILYWDNIRLHNMLHNNAAFSYAGVNPCAEEPLPAGGSCLLGSINLAEFVEDAFTDAAHIKWTTLGEVAEHAVYALNDVLDEGLEKHPLKEQRESVRDWRQIGLGVLGMADMLIKLGVTYGSNEAQHIVGQVMRYIAIKAVRASMTLAAVRGAYPKCVKHALVDSNFIKDLNLDDETLDRLADYGLRNSQLLTCAPTGSIGTMLEVSTGIEPIFAMSYNRTTKSLHGKDEVYKVYTKIAQDWMKANDSETLPPYFIESKDIKPADRIKMQASVQKYVDAAISSTINLPKEATVEDVANIYEMAWEAGLKGVTVYRQGCQREGILTTSTPTNTSVLQNNAPKRPKELPADNYVMKNKGKRYLISVGKYEDKPFELFITLLEDEGKLPAFFEGTITKVAKKKYNLTAPGVDCLLGQEVDEEVKAAALYISMLMRHGVDLKFIIHANKKINGFILSISSMINRVLYKYMPAETTGEKCPECGGDLINEGGCIHCAECGWSRCG